MKFVLSTQQLNLSINKIQNVVSLKPAAPILSNFLLEAFDGRLTLTATDLTVGIRCDIEANIIEEGSTTLPARRFAQLLRELTASTIEIASNPHQITTLIAGTSKFKLNGMKKDSFPALPDMTDSNSFLIKQIDLKDMFYRTGFAVSKEDNRYVLTGVSMQIENGRATFIGTDGKRLARAQSPIEIDRGFTSQSIIPLKAVDEILKNLQDEGNAKISISADKIAIETNNTLIIAKLLTGEYPDINRVIPERTEVIVTLHREELTTLLKQISLFTFDNQHSVRFSLFDGEMKLNANVKEFGEGDVSMPVNYHGPKTEIAFNPGYFIDILRHCKKETVKLGLIDAYNPGIVIDGEDLTDFSEASPLFVIMPMRLSED